MPHRRHALLRRACTLAPAALLLSLACSPGSDSPGTDTLAVPGAPAEPAGPAADLDARFQRLRDSLNAEAASLASLDRASAEYATRYDAWRRAASDAERLRAHRDSARRTPAGTAPR